MKANNLIITALASAGLAFGVAAEAKEREHEEDVRYGWKLPKRLEAPHPREVLSPVVGVVAPAESLLERLKQDAEATRIGLSTATRKASLSLAERGGDEVVYVSARLKHVVNSAAQLHGW